LSELRTCVEAGALPSRYSVFSSLLLAWVYHHLSIMAEYPSLGRINLCVAGTGLCVGCERTKADPRLLSSKAKSHRESLLSLQECSSRIDEVRESRSRYSLPLSMGLHSLVRRSHTTQRTRPRRRSTGSPCATTGMIATLRTGTWSRLPHQTPRPLSLVSAF